MNPGISVIIPTLNEAENLSATLAALRDNRTSPEILVVDAGSTDDTASIAREHDTVVHSSDRAGRAHQLNLGAGKASAAILLFLHADTHLPGGALDKILTIFVDQTSLVGGGFLRRFDSPSLLLRITTRLADLRSRHLGLFLGDQAIFVRRSVFENLEGFDESLTLCEDLDFSRRLHAHGETAALGPPILSSARRFDSRGPLRTTLRDLRHAARYFRGPRRR